ncbi:MAG TPA: glutamine--tRNA ligase, partial [Methylophilaceae bacterium]|nr:glutamine--tRNA ligase [Methylophilaceae bacterium]
MSAEKEPIAPASNFIRGIIDRDLAENKYVTKKWAGSPGDATHQASGQTDFAKIRTRFPP